MTTNAIDVRDLRKHYGRTKALDGLNLSVPHGQIAGFLGPNGAGKSTTMHILLGMLHADGGSVTVLGADPWRQSVALHRRLAYVPGDVSLWPNLTGGEAIDLLTRLRGEGKAPRSAISRLVERFELDPTKKTRAYSKGNRQKVALVAALACDVELYLFDEPTSGLDPLMAAVFTDEVRALRGRGRTVLLCSHILGEVQELCDTVTMIREGRDVEHGTLAELRHLGSVSVAVRPQGDGDALVSQLKTRFHPRDLTVESGRVSFVVDSSALNDLLAMFASQGVSGLTIEPPSLEQLFLRRYDAQPQHEGGRR